MSEQKNPQQDGEAERDPEELPESSEAASTADEHDAESSDNRPSGGGGNAVAWLAFLLSLVAVGVAGWQWWLSSEDDGSGSLGSRIDEQSTSIEGQSQQLDELADRLDSMDQRLALRLDELEGRLPSGDFDPARLRREIEARADSHEELEQRLSSLSQRLDEAVSDLESRIERAGAARADRVDERVDDRVDELDETVAEARLRLALIEVAGLLQLGQTRAELAADYTGAVAAYRRAQARLEAFEDGRVEQLRRLVSGELESLRSVEAPDWSVLKGRLLALEAESGQWPLAGADQLPPSDQSPEQSDGEGDGWWSSLRSSMGSLVRVTPRETAALTPAAAESVRERLRLHLAAAQVAVVRRSGDELAQHLEAADELIRDHFDTDSDSVSGALETISEAASTGSPSRPELGGALAEAERRLDAS